MGTKVQYKSYLPGYHSMRDLNEDSHGCSWPLYYGEKACQSGQYFNGILPRATSDAYLGCDRDAVKRKMLEHEAIFKNQVRELHRLYIKQRELMNDFKRSEHRNQIPVDISFSSSPLASQNTPDGARKWHLPSFPLAISSSGGPSLPGVEDVKSSLSSLKENNRSDGLLQSQNGTNSKDCKVLDSRPTKVRRKTFDLQLPADEYVDSEEGEVFHDEKVPPMLDCHSNGKKKLETQSCVTANLYTDSGERSGGQGDALRSDSCLWNRYGLADLNEPVQLEETNGSNFFDLPSARDSTHGETQGPFQSSTKQEILLNSSNGSGHVTNRNSYIENGNGREAFPNIFEAGRSKNGEKPYTHGMEKFHLSSNPMQVPLNKFHELPVFYLNDKSTVQQELDRPVSDLQLSKRSYEVSNTGDPGYLLASQTSRTYPIAHSLDVGKSWAHSGSSWEKPNGNCSQKSTSGHTQPCFKLSAAVHKSFPSSAQNNGIFGDRWHLNNDCPNPGSSCETPYQNGFCLGSTSGSKGGVPSSTIRHDHVANSYKSSGRVGTNYPKDINLNVVLSKSLSNEAGQLRTNRNGEVEQKNEDHHNMLPWSRGVPANKNETINSRGFSSTAELSFVLSPKNQFSDRNETENVGKVICYPNIESNSRCSDTEPKISEFGECQSNRKLLGFPIFEEQRISKNESFSLTSPSVSLPNPSENEVERNGKIRGLDINLPCDPSVFESDNATTGSLAVENQKDTKISNVRVHIDLNSCVNDEEASMRPLPVASSTKEKGVIEIDLEAPAMPEAEEDIIVEEESVEKRHEQESQSPQHKAVDIQDDLMAVAAKALVAISSTCGGHSCHLDDTVSNASEDSSSDPLNWFAEIVSTLADDVETKSETVLRGKDGKDNEESCVRGIDYFEYMTLRMAEVGEEEYMPMRLVPESIEIEDCGTNLLANRPRKGQARRGRQRRDFQKDILPGLSSLSRHEVTEDLQMFGGLMRATGHSWHSGVTRRNSTRNGCGRGRRRSVISPPPPPPPPPPPCNQLIQQLSSIEMGLDDGSLTGWGKTTRRPRRQRCPGGGGNPPAVPLT